MSLFNWLLNRKKSGKKVSTANGQDMKTDDVKVYDEYGRELYITKEQWKENVLIGNLEKAKNNPDQLYNMLIVALQDGFFEEVTKYAEVYAEIDPVNPRGAALLGICYMKCNRLEDAKRVLTDFVEFYDEDGVVLTNLAKVYSEQGHNQKAETILWHALEIDPNQENGLNWYAAIQKERYGEQAFFESFKRVAALPKSWRPQLWLARFALQEKDIHTARNLYRESIEKAGSPTPDDLLVQMSGDLGNNGYLEEIVELVQPHFQVSLHGINIGNNLIRTYFELSQLDKAAELLSQLYGQKRPDWREALSYWDAEIAKRRISIESQKIPIIESATLLSIEAPLWCRDESPFASLLPPKNPAAVKVLVWGNTTLQKSAPQNIVVQFADAAGRASRFIPIFLSEQISFYTNAVGGILVPWIPTKGFVVFGKPNGEKELCELVEKGETPPDFIVDVVINAIDGVWEINANIIRRIDRLALERITTRCRPEQLGEIAQEISNSIIKSLTAHARIDRISPPDWYAVPEGVSSSDYLSRQEQLLSIICMNQDTTEGGTLHGEYEIVDGILFLNLNHPGNKTVRMLLFQTLKQMKKYKPDVVGIYKEKIMSLQKKHPLTGVEGELTSKAISEMF